MAEYSLSQLSSDIQKHPEMLKDVVEFIQYLASPSCKRLTQGKKNAQEFSNVLLFVLESKKLSQASTKWIIEQIYPYLIQNKTEVLLQKLAFASSQDTMAGFKIVKSVLDHSALGGKGLSSLLGWFKGKQEDAEDETFISATKKDSQKKESGRLQKQADSSGKHGSGSYSRPDSSGRHGSGSYSRPEAERKYDTITSSNATDDDTVTTSSPVRPSGRYKKQQDIPLSLQPAKEESTPHRRLVVSPSVDKNLAQVFGEETFSSSKPKKMGILRRVTSRLMGFESQTILSTGSPLRDPEVETLRVQTLVSFKKPINLIAWLPFPKQEDFFKVKPGDVLRMLHGLANQSTISKEAKQALEQLKSGIVVRTKLLAEEEITLNIVNQGIKSFHHTLDRLSQMTSNKKANKKIWEYLHGLTEEKVLAHAEYFRKTLDSCKDNDALDAFLVEYTLESNSVFKKYTDLKIIRAVKDIRRAYERRPGDLTRIMNKYLGTYGEVNVKAKLSQILLTSAVEANLLKKIEKERSLASLHKTLEKLSGYQEFSPGAGKLVEILRTFMDAQNKFSFTQFKAGLNSFSTVLRNKILAIARQNLLEDLKKETDKLLYSSGDPSERLMNFRKVMANTRYHDNSISLYGYALNVIDEKIQTIPSRVPDLDRQVHHIFTNSQVPKSFFSLIIEAKKSQSRSSQKTVENCIQAMASIQEKLETREIVSLKTDLINLFKNYGQVNFSDQSTTTINGYDIAQIIANFYNIPNRTTIDIPENVVIRDTLKQMIDEERSKQLKKMGLKT